MIGPSAQREEFSKRCTQRQQRSQRRKEDTKMTSCVIFALDFAFFALFAANDRLVVRARNSRAGVRACGRRRAGLRRSRIRAARRLCHAGTTVSHFHTNRHTTHDTDHRSLSPAASPVRRLRETCSESFLRNRIAAEFSNRCLYPARPGTLIGKPNIPESSPSGL